MPSQLNNITDVQNMKNILDTTDQIMPQLKKVEFVEVGQIVKPVVPNKCIDPVKLIPSKCTELTEQIVKPVATIPNKCIEQSAEILVSNDLVKVFNIFVPKQTCGLTFILIIIGLIIFYMTKEPKKIDNNNI
jgi:hypothetical protein